MATTPLTDAVKLTKFRAVRQLAYQATQAVAETLEPGGTEKQAAWPVRKYHRSPLWADDKIGGGITSEELLVVTDRGNAFWLDDDLSHVHRWQRTATV